MRVSVVVPMKDEEGSLPLLAEELDGLAEALRGRGDLLEVLLVDDGSTDGTGRVAQQLCTARRGWRLLSHERNRGFGAGFRTGAAAARGEVVVCYDADCAYPAGDTLRLLAALDDGADVATATPYVVGGSADGVGPLRLLLSRGCSVAYRLALRGRARGTRTFTCAFRAYRSELLRGVAWDADGFLAAAEILSRCLLAGARVTEVPSTLRPRVAGASKMRVMRNVLGHLRLLARLAVTRASTLSAGASRGAA